MGVPRQIVWLNNFVTWRIETPTSGFEALLLKSLSHYGCFTMNKWNMYVYLQTHEAHTWNVWNVPLRDIIRCRYWGGCVGSMKLWITHQTTLLPGLTTSCVQYSRYLMYTLLLLTSSALKNTLFLTATWLRAFKNEKFGLALQSSRPRDSSAIAFESNL